MSSLQHMLGIVSPDSRRASARSGYLRLYCSGPPGRIRWLSVRLMRYTLPQPNCGWQARTPPKCTAVTDMIGASGTRPGHNTIVRERSGFKYLIKIIFVMEDDTRILVTAPPFKNGNQK